MIGNASVILVVTISITSRDYILDLIRGVGSNLIYAQYSAGTNNATKVDADFIKMADVDAVRRQLGSRIVAATGVMSNSGRLLINGKEQDVSVIGTDEDYPSRPEHGAAFGTFHGCRRCKSAPARGDAYRKAGDATVRERAGRRGPGDQAVRSAVHGGGNVQGTYGDLRGLGNHQRNRADAHHGDQASSPPLSASIRCTCKRRLASDVQPLTAAVKQILESRHRPGARYDVENLAAILEAAQQIALVMTIVLILVSTIALIISGIGIMNIMLVTVTERTREIGLRMAVGASRHAVLEQFLTESIVISMAGGLIGILVGISIPLSVRFFTDAIRVPISITSVLVAFGVSVAVGVIFGMLPANRASQLNPTEALRYE